MAKSLNDIAKALNLASSTVSRAMTCPELVAPETRQKVLDYIEKVGFRPNLTARNLRKQCTYTIGIVVNDLCDTVIAKAANVMQDEAARRGFFPIVLSSGDSRTKERELLERLFSSNVSGLVVIPSSATSELLSSFPHVPVVELDRSTGDKKFDEYRMDDTAAMQIATDHLCEKLSCTNVAVLLGNVRRVSSFGNRLAALGQCTRDMTYFPYAVSAVKADELTAQACALTQALLMTQPHLQHKAISMIQEPIASMLIDLGSVQHQSDLASASTDSAPDSVPTSVTSTAAPWQYLNLKQLCSSKLKVDAILATNNSIASGVLRACYSLGVEPQKDIQIFTFDNPDWLQVLPFKLPTLTHPLEKAAFMAINRVIDRIEHKYQGPVEEQLICPELVV